MSIIIFPLGELWEVSGYSGHPGCGGSGVCVYLCIYLCMLYVYIDVYVHAYIYVYIHLYIYIY